MLPCSLWLEWSVPFMRLSPGALLPPVPLPAAVRPGPPTRRTIAPSSVTYVVTARADRSERRRDPGAVQAGG
jgi:hypothetical protein